MSEGKSERLEIRVEPSLLARVDHQRGGLSRAEFVRRALLDAVGGGSSDRVGDLQESFDGLERRLSRLEEMAGL